MSLLEVVFALQSHTFLKRQCCFVDEASSFPSCHLSAKRSFVSDFFFWRLFLAPVSLDLHIAECCVYHGSHFLIISVRQAEIKEVDLWIPSCCLNWITVTCVYPNPCLVSRFCANFIQKTEYSLLRWLFKKKNVFNATCFLSVSLCDRYYFTPKFVFRQSHLEVCGLCCFPWLWGMMVRSLVSLMAKVSSNE